MGPITAGKSQNHLEIKFPARSQIGRNFDQRENSGQKSSSLSQAELQYIRQACFQALLLISHVKQILIKIGKF